MAQRRAICSSLIVRRQIRLVAVLAAEAWPCSASACLAALSRVESWAASTSTSSSTKRATRPVLTARLEVGVPAAPRRVRVIGLVMDVRLRTGLALRPRRVAHVVGIRCRAFWIRHGRDSFWTGNYRPAQPATPTRPVLDSRRGWPSRTHGQRRHRFSVSCAACTRSRRIACWVSTRRSGCRRLGRQSRTTSVLKVALG